MCWQSASKDCLVHPIKFELKSLKAVSENTCVNSRFNKNG